jgi:DNA-binding transcriptional LysR family regulator
MAKAAAHLRVTQPAVSQVIADLEHALGVKLLDRNPRGIEPTVYGRSLLRGGTAAFDDLKQTIKEIEFLSESATGEVRIGCPETVAAILPPVIENLYRRYPGIVLHVSEVVAPTLDLPPIRNRVLDVAIVRIVEAPSRHRFADDLDVDVLFNDENVVVADAQSRWARRRKIDLAELVDEHWIVPAAATTSGIVVAEAFRARGISPPKVSLVTFSVALRTNMLASGRHLTVFPRSMVDLYAARMSVKILPVKLPTTPTWPTVLVTLKNRLPNPAVKLFIDQVRTEFKKFNTRA